MAIKFIKLNILIMTLLFALIGCSDVDDNVPTAKVNDSIEDLPDEDIFKQGRFISLNGYTVIGDAELYFNSVNNIYSLVMSGFNSSNGPDLRVYLSQGSTPSNFLNLGALKSTNGTLRYNFSGSNFDPRFNNIIIWCDDFSVSFGQAQLLDP